MAVDTVERRQMSAQRAQRVAKSGVRRCLFGPVSHSETHKFLQEANRKLDDLAVNRWNFDFKTEKPMAGKYIWEKMTPASCNTSDSSSKMLAPAAIPIRKFRVLNSKEPCTPVKSRRLKEYMDCKRARWCPTPELNSSAAHCSMDVENADSLSQLAASQSSSASAAELSSSVSSSTVLTTRHHTLFGAENAKPSKTSVISSSSVSRKRKQSRISEFFPQKKARTDVLRVKRRLDL